MVWLRIAALTVGMLSAIVFGGRAYGEFTSTDQAALLYSTKFGFDGGGVPIISVQLMERQREIRISSPGGVRLRLGETGSPEVLAETKTIWSVRLEGAKPAEVRYYVIVGKAAPSNFAFLRGVVETWRQRGQKTKVFEVGSIFALRGKVLDNRLNLIGLMPGFRRLEEALRAARVVAQKQQIDVSVHAELHRRSSGTLIVTNNQNTMKIRIRDVVWLLPASSQPLTVHSVEFGVGYAWHGREDRRYRGSLYVAVDRFGKLAVVNSVSAEDLLRGIVPSEIFPSAPLEALKVQAIAARGELLAKIGVRHLADPYLTCSSQMCQVYSGIKKETPATNRAVDLTRGVALFAGNRLVDTVYSANAGGFTEHNENVWNSPRNPQLRGHLDYSVADPRFRGGIHDGNILAWLEHPPKTWGGTSTYNRKHFRWKRRLTQTELARLVNRRHPVGGIKGIVSLQRGISGRITRLRIVGTKSSAVVERELTIRRLLGNMKSTMFVVKPG
ncbi:MAG: SpoIID/LytB domain-containing protein, partial [Myxococcales bacterium]|nr:SpoIID/LytB domain-containing protein [Myxococcales bacterium]